MLPHKKSRAIKWITFFVIALLAVGAVVLYSSRRDSKVYERVKAERTDITTYHSFSGNIEAKHRQPIFSKMVMQISHIYVEEGDMVKEGEVLAESSDGKELVAEIDGEVAGISIVENAIVMAGAEIMEIVDYNHLQINMRVDEYDIGSLTKGKEAIVKIGALNKEIKGKVSNLSREGTVMNGVTYFTATIDLNRDQALKVGMSAEVKFINNTAKGVVTIPMSVVQFDDNNSPYVLKENEKGGPTRTGIVTGINNGIMVEVKKGVATGETVLYQKAGNTTRMDFRGRRPAESTNGGGTD